MTKYRKKPIIIEAEQWFPEKKIEGVITSHSHTHVEPYIETLEGTMKVSPGDWVITGINGEKYPCKPDIFEKTYELVEEKFNPTVCASCGDYRDECVCL